jgi:hypothetical protein
MSEEEHKGQLGSSTTVAVLEKAGIETLKASLRGELFQPDDEGYDAVRKVYNGMIDKRPLLIARCADVADVIAAVNFSRENDLLVSIRSGGHKREGWGSAMTAWSSISRSCGTRTSIPKREPSGSGEAAHGATSTTLPTPLA